jgi:hypothetical protein
MKALLIAICSIPIAGVLGYVLGSLTAICAAACDPHATATERWLLCYEWPKVGLLGAVLFMPAWTFACARAGRMRHVLYSSIVVCLGSIDMSVAMSVLQLERCDWFITPGIAIMTPSIVSCAYRRIS